MKVRGRAKGATRWLGQWVAATTAIAAAWAVVTLASGGGLDADGAGCQSPDANPIWTVVMSAAIALPLAAAWSAARAWAGMDEGRRAAARRATVLLALLAGCVVLYASATLQVCSGVRVVLSTVGSSLPPSP